MKKALAICLMIVMVVCSCVTAFAAPGSFVKSPSKNPGPEVEEFTPSDSDCDGKLIITPYAERSTLPEDLKILIEKAYAEIAATNDLTTLNSDLAALAASKNIAGERLAVSDLFDIRVVGCEEHEGHVNFKIALRADTLDRFVGLLHMTKDGVWELVDDAKVTSNGKVLEFTADSLSPFAIVVDTTPQGGGDKPKPGDNGMMLVYIIVMAASASALVVILIKKKKQRSF